MRDPDSRNPNQNSIYVLSVPWAAAKELASRAGMSRSGYIVSLIEREKVKVLGKNWKPKRERP